MVLQQAPKAACVWGFADPSWVGQKVTVALASHNGTITDQKVSAVITARSHTVATWFVKLKPVYAGGPYTLYAVNRAASIAITDVLFGDVWVCSGQSNMQFSTSQLKPADLLAELAIAASYPNVRLFTVLQMVSDVPTLDLITVQQPWSIASPAAINGGNWKFFSAVCWLYGRRLHESLGYPIGLIASDYGGTPVKSWSGPDAIKACATKVTQDTREIQHVKKAPGTYLRYSKDNDEKDVDLTSYAPRVWNASVLWNPMIHPLLNMTIYGAIWYQGEADAGSNIYNCRFPALIKDWRQKFNEGSQGETDAQFPFGFVQLAPWENSTTLFGGFPSIRWQQTANIGYVPNPIMPRTFMAVTMDLPDFSSPFTGIHPQYKESLADRLHLAGMAVAYGARGIKFQGPIPTAFDISISNHVTALEMEYDGAKTLLRVLNVHGFEVCCHNENDLWCPETSPSWVAAPVTGHSPTSVTISVEACNGVSIRGLRYAWRESPCPLKRCAVYSAENFLPAPPFVLNGILWSTVNGSSSTLFDFTDEEKTG